MYFRVSKFPEYGKLAWLDFEGMVAGASEVRGIGRIEPSLLLLTCLAGAI